MPLIKGGRFVADPWRSLADDEAVPADATYLIVSHARWLRERARARRLPGTTRSESARSCSAGK